MGVLKKGEVQLGSVREDEGGSRGAPKPTE